MRRTRHQARAAQAQRRDTLAGVALVTLSVAILAAPFAWCALHPASFTRFVWGF